MMRMVIGFVLGWAASEIAAELRRGEPGRRYDGVLYPRP